MIYRIGFTNGHVIEVEDVNADMNKMSDNVKYVMFGGGNLVVNMKHVAYIEKVGEENDETGKTDRAEEED